MTCTAMCSHRLLIYGTFQRPSSEYAKRRNIFHFRWFSRRPVCVRCHVGNCAYGIQLPWTKACVGVQPYWISCCVQNSNRIHLFFSKMKITLNDIEWSSWWQLIMNMNSPRGNQTWGYKSICQISIKTPSITWNISFRFAFNFAIKFNPFEMGLFRNPVRW